MEYNFWLIFVTALVPMVLGFIWYNPAVFGKAWMAASGMTEEKMKGGNIAKIFGLSFLLSCMLAFIMTGLVIHQVHIQSVFFHEWDALHDATSELGQWYQDAVNRMGRAQMSFKHGAFHGFFIGLFVVLPVFGTNALFERKSFKYVAVNAGYWIVCLSIMGGILCQWYIK